jgi:hypothetical protein
MSEMSDEDAWPEIVEWVRGAPSGAEVVPVDDAAGAARLEELQITVRAPMGAVVRNAEAIVVDHGWLRVLGTPRIGLGGVLDLADGLVVAYDAVGGFFVVRGSEGDLPGDPGEVLYLAPDSLEYERMESGYGQWLRWALDGGLEGFAADLRWPGWEQEATGLSLDQAINAYPPPFTEEGRDLGAAHRRAVPVTELWSLWHDFRGQLGIRDGV